MTEVFGHMRKIIASGGRLDPEAVSRVAGMLDEGQDSAKVMTDNILSTRGKTVRPKTFGQHESVSYTHLALPTKA